MQQLFGEAPVVPVSTGQPDYDAVPPASGPAGYSGYMENTLDEPLVQTMYRDIKRIGKNLRIVLFPFVVGTEQNRSLRNWDLWGPLVGPDSNPSSLTISDLLLIQGCYSRVG